VKGSVTPSHDNKIVWPKSNYLKQPSKSSSIAPASLLAVNSMSKVKKSGYYSPENVVGCVKQFDAGGKKKVLERCAWEYSIGIRPDSRYRCQHEP